MWYEYDFLGHQYVAHLRRVHPNNEAIMMDVVPGEDKLLVKAADPLARPWIQLYYSHSKIKMYTTIFSFRIHSHGSYTANICPWMTLNSKKSLDQLLALEFEKYVLISNIMSKLVTS